MPWFVGAGNVYGRATGKRNRRTQGAGCKCGLAFCTDVVGVFAACFYFVDYRFANSMVRHEQMDAGLCLSYSVTVLDVCAVWGINSCDSFNNRKLPGHKSCFGEPR